MFRKIISLLLMNFYKHYNHFWILHNYNFSSKGGG
jgi:hypothetical protein